MHIPVYHDTSIGTRGEGYNLGDILNMPVFWANWSFFQSLADLTTVASQLPQSIAGRYYNHRSDGIGPVTDDPCMPHRPRLLRAVDEYIADNPEIHPMLQTLQDDAVLCVHLRSGDYGPIDDTFLNAIVQLSKQFAKIVVLSGVHCNGDERFVADNIARLICSLERIRALVPRAEFVFNHPDVHVCCMAKARNLLVHMGGFSIIGSLVFSGQMLYLTNLFQPVHAQMWHDLHIPHKNISTLSRKHLEQQNHLEQQKHLELRPIHPTIQSHWMMRMGPVVSKRKIMRMIIGK
jgi:hypothetical protein